MAPVARAGAAVAAALLRLLVPVLGEDGAGVPQHAFVEPYELAWRENDDASFSGDLYMGVTVVGHNEDSILSMRTRAFGASTDTFTVPGPTIAMSACKTYHLTLHNLLEPPDIEGPWNNFGYVNTTNLHLHGLHISGNAPGDEIFSTTVGPGESYTYTYVIPCDHIGGLFFYHAHYHGSMALQVGGGASGLVKVAYNNWEEIPEQIRSMPQVVMQIKEIQCAVTLGVAEEVGDTIFSCNDQHRFQATEGILANAADDKTGDGHETDPLAATDETALLVNGHVQPEIPLERGQWHHIRTSFVTNGDGYELIVGGGDSYVGGGGCDVELLATDGVWLSEVPRPLPTGTMFFSPSSRLDYAVRCHEPGPVDLVAVKQPITDFSNMDPKPNTTFHAARYMVQEPERGGEDEPAADLEPWVPCRPYYLQDLLGVPAAHPDAPVTITLRGGGRDGTINELRMTPDTGMPRGDWFMELQADSVNEWNIIGSQEHTTHMHINHFQIVNTVDSALTNNWYQSGDWFDTIQTGHNDALVKFRAERFGGPMALHCHILDHSDFGVMVALNILGGSGPLDDPSLQKLGSCDIPPGIVPPGSDTVEDPNKGGAAPLPPPPADGGDDHEEEEEEQGQEMGDAAATTESAPATADALAEEEGKSDDAGGAESWGMAVVGVLAVAGVVAGFAWVRGRRRRRRRRCGGGGLAAHRVPMFEGELFEDGGGGGGGETPGGRGAVVVGGGGGSGGGTDRELL